MAARVGRRQVGFAAFLVAGLAVAFALAFFVSPEASSKPDGLDKVAIDQGFDRTETDHRLDGSPTAGYALRGVGDDRLATGLAGVVGVAVTFLLAGGLTLVVRRRAARREIAGA
ncbi:PDGLE domain-containing protein [Aquihabitans sp. G128]|nr:PDGLE domain-containing protein [Aquihabitans sp. G128]QXC59993.1 PDGLE domain-containing protein [Aquihabitans sp. G128]